MTETQARPRSHCPVNFGVELFGDKWSLLIVRDLLLWGKKTHGELMRSSEGIATNILADRLVMLEREGIIARTPHPTDGRKELLALTEKGIALAPVIVDIMIWSALFDPKTILSPSIKTELCTHREQAITRFVQAAKQGKPALMMDGDHTIGLNKN